VLLKLVEQSGAVHIATSSLLIGFAEPAARSIEGMTTAEQAAAQLAEQAALQQSLPS
jgi:hypothetical protein